MTNFKMPAIGIILALALSCAFIVALCNTRTKGPIKQTERQKSFAEKGFAVLELFTSEGCSSCPAAEDLLAHVQEEAADKPVYVLAYHVDYWNRLGWKDKFSSSAFSKRQYEYHDWLSSQVYTPQLVVNGRSDVVGSDVPAVRRAVEKSMGDGATATLELRSQEESGMINLEYEVASHDPGQRSANQLVIAVVQKHSVSKVDRGENAGLTLAHAQIVRKLYKFELNDNKGSVKIDVPDDLNPQDWEIIGMVQDERSGFIKAACKFSAVAKVIIDAAEHR